jgi:hypothetical protein
MATATKNSSKQEESKRDRARREKEEAAAKARQAKIDSGDLIVAGKDEFERIGKSTKSLEKAGKVLKALDGAKKPVLVGELAKKMGAYYEDILPMFTVLEANGTVERYEAQTGGQGRRQVAYLLKS